MERAETFRTEKERWTGNKGKQMRIKLLKAKGEIREKKIRQSLPTPTDHEHV